MEKISKKIDKKNIKNCYKRLSILIFLNFFNNYLKFEYYFKKLVVIKILYPFKKKLTKFIYPKNVFKNKTI